MYTSSHSFSLTPIAIFSACFNAGRALKNGQGVLADGTEFDRQSGEEHGPNGYWFRWHRLKGKSGKVGAMHAVRGARDPGGVGGLKEQSIACIPNAPSCM